MSGCYLDYADFEERSYVSSMQYAAHVRLLSHMSIKCIASYLCFKLWVVTFYFLQLRLLWNE